MLLLGPVPESEGWPRRGGAVRRQGRADGDGGRFIRQALDPPDAAQPFQDAVVELDAVDPRLSPPEGVLGVLRRGGVRENPGAWRLRLVVAAREPLAVLALDLRHEHLAWDAEVPVCGIVLAQPPQLRLQRSPVEAAFAEQGAHDGAVHLLGVRVVVLPVRAGPRERHLPALAAPFGDGAAHVLLAVVVVDAPGLEGDAPERGVKGIARSVHASVPYRLELRPLRLAVGRRERPPEVSAHVPAAVRHRVGLDVARRHVASLDELARPALDGLEQLVVAARPAVALHRSGLLAFHAPEQAVHRRRAHGEKVRGDVVGHVRDAGAELPQPLVDVRLEVGCAWTPHLAPYAHQDGPVPFGVCRPASLALLEFPAPRQEPVRVLSRVARRLAHLVEELSPFFGLGVCVRPALSAYVFVRCHS